MDGPIRGVSVKHRGIVPAKEERRLEIWKECIGGRTDGGSRQAGEVNNKLHAGFLALAHCDSRPLVSGAAE